MKTLAKAASKLAIGKDTTLHYLPATPETVHWGYFDNSIPAVRTINSGDLVYAETVTHHAGDAPDLLMDEGIREIYESIPAETRAPGPHLLTGPIYVRDAQPGDVLQVEILQLTPRLQYGSNILASWGHLFKEFNERERVTIYELDQEGQWLTAKFAYDYPTQYNVNGRIIDPESVERVSALPNMQIPARLHIGTMGVAPRNAGRWDTVPPGEHGGNLDNWRITTGSTMYYPVLTEGALLSVGDCHFAQGDSELSGTAVEASMNVLLRITLRKDFNFSSPLLETPTTWVTHGFDADLNVAMRKASLEMLKFVQQHYGLSDVDAYSFLSLAGDFAITQVVDQLQGVHCSIPKSALNPKR